ncbi:MAG: hypothetical protein IT515_10940 [Burkholderiales bacterium]|nr:hypothetical protein [Burkholderiales bacterium]
MSNIVSAKRLLRIAAEVAYEEGACVVAHWIPLCEVLTDCTPEMVEHQLRGDEELARRCDELWLAGPRISGGMMREAEAAWRAGREVFDLTGRIPMYLADAIRKRRL